jgi:F0F1-type ATP synthase membrane subunit c/vacuolar-type H+-ATPase subunit K
MTGLACFGGTAALGLLTSKLPAAEGADERDARIRGLYIVQVAFIEGIAILGVVVGLLAVTFGHTDGALLAAGPAVVGAVFGVGIAFRAAAAGDRQAALLGVWFIVGLGVLGVVTGLLAVLIADQATTTLADWPFVLLGLVVAASVLGIGLTGGAALQAAAGVDVEGVKLIQAAQLTRCLWLEIIGLGAAGIAILLILVD